MNSFVLFEGDTKGSLTVIKVLKRENRHLSKKQQWYLVRCECGHEEETYQDQLRKRQKCSECQKEDKARSISRAKQAKKGSSIPKNLDFSRIRFTNHG